MDKRYTSISVRKDLYEKLKFIADTQGLTMQQVLDNILNPFVQLLGSFKLGSVVMASHVRVLPSEVTFEFYGTRVIKIGQKQDAKKETEGMVSSKLEKETEK